MLKKILLLCFVLFQGCNNASNNYSLGKNPKSFMMQHVTVEGYAARHDSTILRLYKKQDDYDNGNERNGIYIINPENNKALLACNKKHVIAKGIIKFDDQLEYYIELTKPLIGKNIDTVYDLESELTQMELCQN